MKIYYFNTSGYSEFLKEIDDEDKDIEVIVDFCKEHNYHIPYIRTYYDNNGDMIYDVGSWTEFFKIVK